MNSWIEQEIHSFKNSHPERSALLERINNLQAQIQDSLLKLETIVAIGDHRLIPRAYPAIHDIEFLVVVITYYYFPALQRETEEDKIFRKLLLETTKRLQLDWIEDIVVRLDGAHASVVAIPETPVLFLPPQHAISTIDMPGLYHELGHDVFQQFPNIIQTLSNEVTDYYENLKLQSGLLSPDQIAERNRVIDEAIEYWEAIRLVEIFCDIFATYVVGPAHYFSIVDLALRHDRNPLAIEKNDIHPPFAARVFACYCSLHPKFHSVSCVDLAMKAWEERISKIGSNPEYELKCAEVLINHLTNVSIIEIENIPATIKKYTDFPDFITNNLEIPTDVNLEDAINFAVNILASRPDDYKEWEKNNFPKIIRN